MIVSNIGSTPDFSAIYTSNSGMHTATVQVSLKEDHKTGSYEYMARVRRRLAEEMPEITAYFQSGGLVDAVLESRHAGAHRRAGVRLEPAAELRHGPSNWPDRSARSRASATSTFRRISIIRPLQLDIDRTRAGELGLTQKEVVGNIITALTSNAMIAPSFWIDPKTGNDYMLTVQYPETADPELRRPAGDSGARQGHCRIHAPGRGVEYPHASSRPPKWTITSCGA